MATSCTTSQFTTNGGIIGLDRSAMVRVVARSTAQSTGDGEHGAHQPLAVMPAQDWSKVDHRLKVMIDQRVHWKNDYGCPVTIQTQIQRARRTMILSSPNFAFIRERTTHRVGRDSGGTSVLAPDPDPSSVWDTEWGGGMDNGMRDGRAVFGVYRASTPAATLMLEPVRVGVGESIDVRFRAALITPWTWVQKELIDGFEARMDAFSNTLMLWAFPEPV